MIGDVEVIARLIGRRRLNLYLYMCNVLRYAEQVFVEINGTHFRKPGGKIELRCEAEPDCVVEIILSLCICFVGIGIVIWVVLKIKR